MSVWVWVLIGAADLITLSLLIGLVAAAILGSISREVSNLLDLEPWATATLTPASEPRLTFRQSTRKLIACGEIPRRRAGSSCGRFSPGWSR
jgi:hypothetical protein